MLQYDRQYLHITHSCVCSYLSIVVYISERDVPREDTADSGVTVATGVTMCHILTAYIIVD